MHKKSIWILGVLGLVFGVLLYFGLNLFSEINKLIDTPGVKKIGTALYVGTYKETSNSEDQVSLNKLYIEIVSNGLKYREYEYQTDSSELTVLENQDESIVWINLTEDIENLFMSYPNGDELTIDSWSKLNTGNYIKVCTEYLQAPYISSWYEINDSGLYAINIPTSNNETVNVVHAYVYENTEYSW